MYADLQGRITNLLASLSPTYAVPSPAVRHVVLQDWTVPAVAQTGEPKRFCAS